MKNKIKKIRDTKNLNKDKSNNFLTMLFKEALFYSNNCVIFILPFF